MSWTENADSMSFWDHLDVLRVALMKIAAVAVVFGVAAFFFKEMLFAVILAPKEAGFITYRLLNEASGWVTDARSMDFPSVGCLPSWIFWVNFMCRYRKHTVVIILIVAAVVTLTSGVFRSRQ